VDCAIDLLLAVAQRPGVGVSELARKVGLTKARAFRLLHSMAARGLIEQEKQGTYHLGIQAVLLGKAAAEQIDLVRLAQPLLEKIGAICNESVQLRVRDNLESICVASWEPPRDVRFHAVTGKRRPLYVGAGKVLLAFAPPEVQ